MSANFLTSKEVLEKTIDASVAKTMNIPQKQFLLGIMGGVFTAFASFASAVASSGFSGPTVRFISGLVFPIGVILTVICGGEVLPGNALMLTAFMDKRVKFTPILINWFFVFLGNITGSLIVILLLHSGGHFGLYDNIVALNLAASASSKTQLSFFGALSLGVLCNILICCAVWGATAAQDITGKILAIFYPIMVFITSGFENSVANMFYIPAGILIKNLRPEVLIGSNLIMDNVTVYGFLVTNLLPVALGNILGGAFLVGGMYMRIHSKD